MFANPTTTAVDDVETLETTIKRENPENTTSITENVDNVSQIIENLPNDEESSNDQEGIPCSVKTKPYYSINAKLAQKEKKPTAGSLNGPGIATKQHEKDNYPDNRNEESSAITEDRCPLLENVKPPPIHDTNYRFLGTSTSGRPTQQQGCNKTSVTCLICGKQLSNQYNLRVHMETHSNSSYSCTACSHVSRSRDALRKHVSYRHPVAAPQKRPRYSITKP